MKKSILSITLILILTTILISCWCPVGNPNDYEDIKDNRTQEAYPLYSGKAYHADAMFSYSENGSRNTYKFIAESDVHCQFAVKLYQGDPECKITIDFKEISNPFSGFFTSLKSIVILHSGSP